MDCEYWKDMVARLRDPNRCNWACHVLSNFLPSNGSLDETNLGAMLRCIPAGEVIEATIYAYRDWSAQPYCDLVLAEFKSEEVLEGFSKILQPDAQMKLGVLGFLENTNNDLAIKVASIFIDEDGVSENKKLRS